MTFGTGCLVDLLDVSEGEKEKRLYQTVKITDRIPLEGTEVKNLFVKDKTTIMNW